MYKILYKKSVEKELRKLAVIQRKIVIAKIQALADNPHPIGATKLRGSSDLFRMRHADYRIIYQIDGTQLIVMVVKVGHRREVYRDF
jgi:mRNA interferase RelE/StbE